MSVRYLGLALLVCFPQVLHAQPCGAPRLDGGYFVPEQQMYAHGTELTYACDNGSKPAVEGWWAMSTCKNGVWSPKPQCIDQDACLPPTIPFATYTENQDGWYEDGHKIRIKCDKGYESVNRDATAVCRKGTWSSVPLCEKSSDACGEPPQIPHAVIIQEYQEVFAADSQVQYECEDGYTVEGAENRKIIFCIGGQWTAGPTCKLPSSSGSNGRGIESTRGTGNSDRGTGASGGTGSSDRGTGASGSTGSSDRGTGASGGTGSFDRGTGASGGTGSFDRGTGASGGTGGSDRGTVNSPTEISFCGDFPVVPDGDVVEAGQMFLRYHCNTYYVRVGPERVYCNSNGKWSEKPICKAMFCSVDTDRIASLESDGVKYIKDGEKVRLKCEDLWVWNHYSEGTCINGKIRLSNCCTWLELKTKTC